MPDVLIERLAGHLSDETGYLDQYQEATEQGAVVLAVGAGHGKKQKQADEECGRAVQHGNAY